MKNLKEINKRLSKLDKKQRLEEQDEMELLIDEIRTSQRIIIFFLLLFILICGYLFYLTYSNNIGNLKEIIQKKGWYSISTTFFIFISIAYYFTVNKAKEQLVRLFSKITGDIFIKKH